MRSFWLWSVVAASLALAGCGAAGIGLDDVEVDRSIVTGSIQATPAPGADAARLSDEATIRNAVSSAALDGLGEAGLAWANAETGSRGTIGEIVEANEDGFLCRRFVATRESFDGVHLFRGETCLGSAKLWVMKAFAPFE